MTVVYSIIFALSLFLLPGYFIFVRKKKNEPWLFVLFLSISVTFLGWMFLSFAWNLEVALLANKVAYLGQISILICMLMLITKLCGFYIRKWVPIALIATGVLMFAIVCTTGYLDWYYESVELIVADGAIKLEKTYGFLHPTYLIYVLLYTSAELAVIIAALCKKRDRSPKLAGLMLAVVLGNIGTWVVEKVITWNFEFLSVSYLMSEFVLFFVYILLQDYIHVNDVPPPVVVKERTPVIVVDNLSRAEKIQKILERLPEGTKLSARQTDILEGILDGKSRKEMAADLHLSENTVKMHTSSLYRLLDVSSREEIFAIFK